MDAEKALSEIQEIVRDAILDDFVRELLQNLRQQDEENRAWAESTIEWLTDEIWGDPDAGNS